jgi:hypothetical protein
MNLPMTGTWILVDFLGMYKTRNRAQHALNIVVSGMCWNALGATEAEQSDPDWSIDTFGLAV